MSTPTIEKSGTNSYTLYLNTSVATTNSKIVAVLYDANNARTGMTTITPEIGETSNEIEIKSESSARTAKIFFWDSLDYMTPISETVDIRINYPNGGGGGSSNNVTSILKPCETPIPSAPSGGGGDSSSNISVAITPTPEIGGE